MATPISMPRQGQSVETCSLSSWKKKKGDLVKKGEILCTYETDKASFELESPADGTMLEIFFNEGDDVAVLCNIAVIGTPGEESASFKPSDTQSATAPKPATSKTDSSAMQSVPQSAPAPLAPQQSSAAPGSLLAVSPRARRFAADSGLTVADVAMVAGTGAHGRVIEKDVKEALPRLTPAAAARKGADSLFTPSIGTGIGGRIRSADLLSAPLQAGVAPLADAATDIKVSGMRKLIAGRMMESLQGSAQLTMHSSANATMLLEMRKQLKANRETLGLSDITITDLLVLCVSRTLIQFPAMNALFMGETIRQYENAHVAIAVDTPRGLMVPVIKFANRMPLNDLSIQLKSLSQQCQSGTINPDLLGGGTFTISNLGGFGIESFTPVLNYPQVGLLGVNTIIQRPVAGESGAITLAPHIGLSLTIDHRAIDGAPAARFLQALVKSIEAIALTVAIG